MYQVFLYIALFIGIVPFLVLIYKNKVFDFKQPIVPFIWVTAIATLYEYIGTILLQIDTAYWLQFYTLLEFGSLYYFFYRLLIHWYKELYKVFSILFVLIYGLSFFYWIEYGNILVPNAITNTFLTLFVFIFSFLWVKKLFEKMHIPNLWKNAEFYFISGFVIYYSCTFLFFLLSDLIFNGKLYYYDYSFVNVLATLILRVFLIIGVWNMNRN